MAAKKIWTEVYRPKTLAEYVFQNEQQKAQINRMVLDQDIPQLLLSGTAGSGKTSLVEILINELKIDDMDVLRINASDNNGIDFVRDTILNFASSFAVGKFKVIKLEEFDYMSHNAQGMLRAVFEENVDNCRFICTCNFENKIIVPIKSRMQQIRFKAPNKDDTLIRMVEILAMENVEFDEETLQKYVDQAYPDIRKIINNLQLNTFDGKLGQPQIDSDGGDYQFKILDLIIAGNLREIRKLVCEQLSSEQVVEVYEFLWKNITKHPKLSKDRNLAEQALVIIAEGEYKNNLTAIPHLNFEATCIKLFNVVGE